ncbi:MAG: Hsp20/alpha crystallin family protein [Gemmatimonadota bacterium]|nr:Hsp20/alpha crystallin family protein [Gemmatimonadota bacterium]
MSLIRWTPTGPALRGRTFFDPFTDLFDSWASDNRDTGLRVDLAEKEDHYVISAELPGVKNEDLSVTVENDLLTVSAEKRDEFEGKDGSVFRRERTFGRVSRSFRLGNQVDVEKIDAEYKDGVLTVTLPKLETVKPRELKVKVK